MNGRFSISAMGKSRVSSMCDRIPARSDVYDGLRLRKHLNLVK
ncbi:hypothetical protein COO91_02267 [Nostoc flagelliforme CCNUN1]|uniref:Uncharacterized protein n=1 Tax=Nostoc flagelliforme CCNUN1 TaxID=2038116 RepID=A0A2K8SND6_9NOSO|nr:hypothetical protein COO91_02267 [Nostoc flagelliforme CCNUN1]